MNWNRTKDAIPSKASIALIVIAILVIFGNVFIVNFLNQKLDDMTVKNECLTNAIQLEDKKATLTILSSNAINIYGQLENGDDKSSLGTMIDEASDLIDYSTTDAVTQSNFNYSDYRERYAVKTREVEEKTDALNAKCTELINKYKLAQSE